MDGDPRGEFLIGLGGWNLFESRNTEPHVLTFRLNVEPDLREAFQLVLVGGEILSGHGECGFDLEFLDLLDVCEEIDYEFVVESHGRFLGIGVGA